MLIARKCCRTWFQVFFLGGGVLLHQLRQDAAREEFGESLASVYSLISAEPGHPRCPQILHLVPVKIHTLMVPMFIAIYRFLLFSTLLQYLTEAKAKRKE